MNSRLLHFAESLLAALFPLWLQGQAISLKSVKDMEPHDVVVEEAVYQGRTAIRVLPAVPPDVEMTKPKNREGGRMVVLPGRSFHNGTIELDVAGKPRVGASSDARGFVGVAF